jgi:RNA polymerase sigma factor (sigma-70 family)
MDEHRDDVWRFVAAVAGRQDADDCFQETFLAALRAYPSLKDAKNLKSWLMTIAFRKAIDSHRARRRGPVPVAGLPEISGADGHAEPDDRVWDALRTLPKMQRAAVAYRYVSDLPYRDIAKALSCSEDSARQNVRLGLRKLREALDG